MSIFWQLADLLLRIGAAVLSRLGMVAFWVVVVVVLLTALVWIARVIEDL